MARDGTQQSVYFVIWMLCLAAFLVALVMGYVTGAFNEFVVADDRFGLTKSERGLVHWLRGIAAFLVAGPGMLGLPVYDVVRSRTGEGPKVAIAVSLLTSVAIIVASGYLYTQLIIR